MKGFSIISPSSYAAKPGLDFGNGASEERKMMVFLEFLLRHYFDHILDPEKPEQEVIRDEWNLRRVGAKTDPKSFSLLRSALADPMNGLKGESLSRIAG